MSLSALASIGTAILGAKSQADANQLTEENNALQKEQWQWNKAKEVPAVAGAQGVLTAGNYLAADGKTAISSADYDALSDEQKKAYTFNSQFQPFIDSAGQTAVGAGNVANQYLGNVPHFQKAGLQGLQQYQNLAGLTPEAQLQLADQYASDYSQGAYNLAAEDINRNAQTTDYNNARSAGRFGALSSQKARKDAFVDQGRTRELLQAAERAKTAGYDRAQSEIARKQGLAGDLSALGTSGLSQATSASALGSNAVNAGINTAFKPFQAYNTTVSGAPNVTAPTYQATQDPFATGAGLGLQAWSNFNKGSN